MNNAANLINSALAPNAYDNNPQARSLFEPAGYLFIMAFRLTYHASLLTDSAFSASGFFAQ